MRRLRNTPPCTENGRVRSEPIAARCLAWQALGIAIHHSEGVIVKPANTLQRRQMLAASAAGLGALGLGGWSQDAQAQGAAASAAKPLPPLAGWKDPKAMIVHSSSTLETRRAAYGTSIITPTNRLFVRNNLPAPDASILDQRDAWSVAFEGVKNPRSLTVADLKTLGVETVATVLQCSGNGRGFSPASPVVPPGRWALPVAYCGAGCLCVP